MKIKSLFLLDGIGALISAFMLGVVLVYFQPYFGIPISTLYLLAAIPCFFALYDFFCYFFQPNDLASKLRIIAILNITYCLLSMALAIMHRADITTLGWLYIVGEVFIVIALAVYEIKMAQKSKRIQK